MTRMLDRDRSYAIIKGKTEDGRRFSQDGLYFDPIGFCITKEPASPEAASALIEDAVEPKNNSERRALIVSLGGTPAPDARKADLIAQIAELRAG